MVGLNRPVTAECRIDPEHETKRVVFACRFGDQTIQFGVVQREHSRNRFDRRTAPRSLIDKGFEFWIHTLVQHSPPRRRGVAARNKEDSRHLYLDVASTPS